MSLNHLQMSAPVSRYQLSASSVPRILLYVLGALTLAHLSAVAFHLLFGLRMEAYTQLFDLDLEANMPTYFNSLLFLLCALLSLVIAMGSAGVLRRGWLTLCGIFVFLAIDEGSEIHEKFMLVTLRLLNHGEISGTVFGWLYYAWVIPYGIAAIGLGLWLTRWFLAVDTNLRGRLVLSGAVYVFGAVFLEMLSGKIAEGLVPSIMTPEQMAYMPCSTYEPGTCHLYVSPTYILVYTCEEVCEMLGLIMAVHTMIRWLRNGNTVVELSFAARPQQDRAAHVTPEPGADDLSGGGSREMIHRHQPTR